MRRKSQPAHFYFTSILDSKPHYFSEAAHLLRPVINRSPREVGAFSCRLFNQRHPAVPPIVQQPRRSYASPGFNNGESQDG